MTAVQVVAECHSRWVLAQHSILHCIVIQSKAHIWLNTSSNIYESLVKWKVFFFLIFSEQLSTLKLGGFSKGGSCTIFPNQVLHQSLPVAFLILWSLHNCSCFGQGSCDVHVLYWCSVQSIICLPAIYLDHNAFKSFPALENKVDFLSVQSDAHVYSTSTPHTPLVHKQKYADSQNSKQSQGNMQSHSGTLFIRNQRSHCQFFKMFFLLLLLLKYSFKLLFYNFILSSLTFS